MLGPQKVCVCVKVFACITVKCTLLQGGFQIAEVVFLTECSLINEKQKRLCEFVQKASEHMNMCAHLQGRERAWSVVCVFVCVRGPVVLGSLSPFLILCILNQDHTSRLSDDKRSFGHFCQQAQLQS